MAYPIFRKALAALLKVAYRVEIRGEENLENLGDRVLIVVNHVSFLDAALLIAFLRHEPVFAINTAVAQWWWIRPLHRLASLFPIDPRNPMATKSLVAKIKEGRPCVIFPEGRISVTGALMKVYGGPAWIAEKSEAVIVPVRLDGAERSPFSRLYRGQVRRRWFPKIKITILPPRRIELPEALKGKQRRQMASLQLYEIMSDMVFRTQDLGPNLMAAMQRARRIHGGGFPVVEDPSGRVLSYRRLLMGAFALGHSIEQLTRPGERVGVLLPNANAAVVTFFALQAFGRVPAMLNFSTGIANMQSALVAAEVRTILTSREFVTKAKLEPVVDTLAQQASIVCLEHLAEGIGTLAKLRALVRTLLLPFTAKDSGIGPDDPAVVLFTSGSEGRPKGVVLSQGNLLANCAQASARVDYNENDKCFNALPVFHSFGLTAGTILPMVAGVRVYMYPSPLHYRIVPELVYDSESTIMFGTNSFLKGYARPADPYDFHAMRYVFAGGEPVQDENRQLWFDKFGIRILSGYGTTETAPVIAINTPMHYRAGTVGRFLPGITWRLEPVPGVERGGRLWVKGPNVMLGYLRYDQPGVLDRPEDGWYDTGDIVEIDAEGYVTILGRAKRFAKVGGEMVSLAAIEAFVEQVAPAHLHAIVAVHDARKGERLVLVTDAQGLDRQGLTQAARGRGLSEINVPSEVVTVPAMPLLGTGKIDYPAVQRLVEERAKTPEMA